MSVAWVVLTGLGVALVGVIAVSGLKGHLRVAQETHDTLRGRSDQLIDVAAGSPLLSLLLIFTLGAFRKARPDSLWEKWFGAATRPPAHHEFDSTANDAITDEHHGVESLDQPGNPHEVNHVASHPRPRNPSVA